MIHSQSLVLKVSTIAPITTITEQPNQYQKVRYSFTIGIQVFVQFCAKSLGKRSMPSWIFYKTFQCNCDILIIYVCIADAIHVLLIQIFVECRRIVNIFARQSFQQYRTLGSIFIKRLCACFQRSNILWQGNFSHLKAIGTLSSERPQNFGYLQRILFAQIHLLSYVCLDIEPAEFFLLTRRMLSCVYEWRFIVRI